MSCAVILVNLAFCVCTVLDTTGGRRIVRRNFPDPCQVRLGNCPPRKASGGVDRSREHEEIREQQAVLR
jgi:hypothetical protein